MSPKCLRRRKLGVGSKLWPWDEGCVSHSCRCRSLGHGPVQVRALRALSVGTAMDPGEAREPPAAALPSISGGVYPVQTCSHVHSRMW